MIHIIGNIAICINAQLQGALLPGEHNDTTSSLQLDLGGHGTLQAISAARCGARVSLISKTSLDLLGKYVLDILRKEGVQTPALSKNAPQSDLTITLSGQDQITQIGTHEDSTGLDVDTLPAEYFNARSLIVISSSIPVNEEIIYWLEHVRLNGAKIMLCMREDNKDLAPYADIIVRDETTKLPASYEESYLITTKSFGTKGAQAQKGRVIACSLEEQGNNGSETSLDIFCGYFAACLQAGLALPRALKISCNAASLSAESNGSYSAIPHLGYLEDLAEETEEKIKAQWN